VISISGEVRGDELSVRYDASDAYLRDTKGNIVVAGPIFAHVTKTPVHDIWLVSVELPDNTELISPASNAWVWLVTESSRQGRYHYFLPSAPATLTYAASRPRRAMATT
jgi:hypothetical protein